MGACGGAGHIVRYPGIASALQPAGGRHSGLHSFQRHVERASAHLTRQLLEESQAERQVWAAQEDAPPTAVQEELPVGGELD